MKPGHAAAISRLREALRMSLDVEVSAELTRVLALQRLMLACTNLGHDLDARTEEIFFRHDATAAASFHALRDDEEPWRARAHVLEFLRDSHRAYAYALAEVKPSIVLALLGTGRTPGEDPS